MTPGPAERLARVREAIASAARAAGRDPSGVTLVAVSKTFPAAAVEALHRAGQVDFGENRVQEAAEKAAALPASIRWHLVGHLQGNKAGRAVGLFPWIHSLDSAALARRVERLAGEAGRAVDGLVQVDLAGEEAKSGLPPEELPALLEEAKGYRHLRLRGLMLLPPLLPDPRAVRPYFRRLRELAGAMERRGLLGADGRVELSMGMSHDFAVAVEEGATLVRVGTAIFGERS
jgi:pyridoxal phosphate enzyme (YggS family)